MTIAATGVFDVVALISDYSRISRVAFNNLISGHSLPWNIKDQIVIIIAVGWVIPSN